MLSIKEMFSYHDEVWGWFRRDLTRNVGVAIIEH